MSFRIKLGFIRIFLIYGAGTPQFMLFSFSTPFRPRDRFLKESSFTSAQSSAEACAGAASLDGETRPAPLLRGRRLPRSLPNGPPGCSRAGPRLAPPGCWVSRGSVAGNRRHTAIIFDNLSEAYVTFTFVLICMKNREML